MKPENKAGIIRWLEEETALDSVWEKAYTQFETPGQEIRKFQQRLVSFGAHTWPRDCRVLELFCGRGNGLKALEMLGFTHLEGVDLSLPLLHLYQGPAQLYAGDCRCLGLDDNSRDVVLVHGGLHHLPELSIDLVRVYAQVRRVLKPGGLFCFTEPWRTPFLRFVHAVCRQPAIRVVWPRIRALHCMIEHEKKTYLNWLDHGREVLELTQAHFQTITLRIGWGKIRFVGQTTEHNSSEKSDSFIQ